MNARDEAYQRLGGRYEVRVLEPSPPAVSEPPWYADDPAARGEVPPGRRLVSPVGTGDLRWAELAAEDPELAAWCAERWLGSYPRLGPVPDELVSTRLALHRLAEQILSPARRHVNGKIGLRYARGGFGTPFYGDEVQLRVDGPELVVQQASRERRAPIASLAAAADLVGREALPDDVELDDQPLQVDIAAASFIGDWFGFAASVLEQLRSEADAALEPSRVQLWPEHFDMAVELGGDHTGARAAYGLSPGDEHHPEPYVYVVPWVAPPPGELWQATGFTGAELPYGALLAADGQREPVLGFLRDRIAALVGG